GQGSPREPDGNVVATADGPPHPASVAARSACASARARCPPSVAHITCSSSHPTTWSCHAGHRLQPPDLGRSTLQVDVGPGVRRAARAEDHARLAAPGRSVTAWILHSAHRSRPAEPAREGRPAPEAHRAPPPRLLGGIPAPPPPPPP